MLKTEALNVYSSGKILPLSKAATLIASRKKQGKTVGLCNGGFDLLHPGHVKHFESAKNLCDVLVVSVTSDKLVESRKGTGRPIFTEKLRAYMIAVLSCVDYVIITDMKGLDVICFLKPSYYIKGPDFIGKQTPGITAEREAIARVGGEMKYTTDPKLSTTEIIDYIKKEIVDTTMLLILDRDGTIILDDGFFGKDPKWKVNLRLNEPVISLLSYIKTKFKTTMIVTSNQSGVARGFFPKTRVKEINQAIAGLLKPRGIKIDHWAWCLDMDADYVKKHPQLAIPEAFIKKVTKRKPSTAMVDDALTALGKTRRDFDHILILGDHHDDEGLAKNLKAPFIDARGASYKKLLNEFSLVAK